ncbi:MAG: hypothetical protein QM804_16745 [Propionicimonas sp.]
MGRLRPGLRRTTSVALTVGIATALTVGLTGCAPDTRIEPVAQELLASVSRAAPLVIGARTAGVTKALEEAGDATRVMVPILVPDLTPAAGQVTAETTATEQFQTVEEAAAALGDSGQVAWQKWIEANRDAVGYVETLIPVTTSAKGSDPVTVQVDEAALKTFVAPVEAANLKLFVSTAEKLPQWQRTIVTVNAGGFIPEITGLTGTFLGLAELESVEPSGEARFAVSVRHPDAKEAIRYQVEQALKSFGTGKIWGKVSRKEFEARMASVELPSDFALTSTQAQVMVTTAADGQYDPALSLADNLAAQAGRYRVAVDPASFTPPADLNQLRSAAIDAALKELDKRTVAEQKRPGTKLLVGGKSGQSTTVKNSLAEDLHVTFFKWGSKKQVVSAFIKAHKSLRLRLPKGSYRLVYASGKNWYGKKYSFGPTGQYSEFKTSSSSKALKIVVKANYTYTVSIGSGGNVPSGSTENPFEK